jgi:hypothetical protein
MSIIGHGQFVTRFEYRDNMGKFLIRWKYVISQRLVKNEIQRTSDFIVYFAMHLVTNTVGANCLIGIK